MRVKGTLCHSDKVTQVSWCNKGIENQPNYRTVNKSNIRWCKILKCFMNYLLEVAFIHLKIFQLCLSDCLKDLD